MRFMRVISTLLLIIATMPLSALELKQGKMKLELFADTGRFALYYLSNPQKEQYTPLFFSDDPRTSRLSIFQDNKLFRMGDSSAFSMTTQHTGNDASFVWTSKTLKVVQKFQLIRSQGASSANGVLITLTIQNTSDRPTKVGAQYLIDTTLGEHAAAQFHTQAEGGITHEAAVPPSPSDTYVLSEASASSEVGLEIMIYGPGLTPPDKVVLANWKRLSESQWDFSVNTSRDFNLLPYSINDSAVMLYYNPENLAPGATRTIVTAIGNKNSGGFAAQSSAVAKTGGAAGIAQSSNNVLHNGQTQDTALQQDYQKASELLREIEQLLTAPSGTVTDKRLKSLQNQLSALEARKAQYAQ